MTKISKLIIYTITLCLLSTFFLYLISYILPIEPIGQSQHISIYDVNNNLIYESNFTKSTKWVNSDDIPDFVKVAFVSIEDKRFYKHTGFDFIRIAKALISNITSGDIVAGGSTITQQYARSLFLNTEKSFQRKIKEAFYAMQIEMHYDKEQILEGYLNTLDFGHGIYGIGEASKYFFGVEAKDLNLAQTCMLVGIVNAPSAYSPILNYDNSITKQRLILYSLFKNRIITLDQYEEARSFEIKLVEHTDDRKLEGYYKDTVLIQLKNLGYLNSEYLKNGLQVKTYYDPKAQLALQQSIDKYNNRENMQVSAIVMRPYSFEVAAISGGSDYTITQYNRAIDSYRQIGSTIKPLLYYCALQNGFLPSTVFLSEPTVFQVNSKEIYEPTNYKNKYPFSDISMIQAISVSDNIYAVKTHLFLGVNVLGDALRMFNIDIKKDLPSLSLGSISTSIYQLSKVYNTFASEGYYRTPQFIDTISDNTGNLIYKNRPEQMRILDHDNTLILNQLLRAPYDIKNIGYSVPTLLGYEPRNTTGAKSGSTEWDSITIGFNPLFTIGVWNGYDDNTPMLDPNERAISKNIFRETFNKLMYNKKDVWYVPTNNIIAKKVNPITGVDDPNGSVYWFKKSYE